MKTCADLMNLPSPESPDKAPHVPATPTPQSHNTTHDGIDKSMYYSMYQAASKSVIRFVYYFPVLILYSYNSLFLFICAFFAEYFANGYLSQKQVCTLESMM